MADISAIFGSLLIFGIAFPGMLTAWRSQARTFLVEWACHW